MEAHLLQTLFSESIVLLLLPLGMIAAIHLDNKTFTLGNGIHYIIAHYMLAVKACTHLQLPQFLPQDSLREGHVASVLFG